MDNQHNSHAFFYFEYKRTERESEKMSKKEKNQMSDTLTPFNSLWPIHFTAYVYLNMDEILLSTSCVHAFCRTICQSHGVFPNRCVCVFRSKLLLVQHEAHSEVHILFLAFWSKFPRSDVTLLCETKNLSCANQRVSCNRNASYLDFYR